MQKHYRGFSLMESLVTLLVLSIGILGLGQLQARLWVNAGVLHTVDEAHLLATNLIELNEINTLLSMNGQEDLSNPPTATSSIFHHELSVFSASYSTTVETRVSWESALGADTVTLYSTLDTGHRTEDARWLLPSN